MKLRIKESDEMDDLYILLDKYFNADTYNLTEYHFESGLWTLDYEYDSALERMKDVIRYNGKRVASFGYCGYPNRDIYNGIYANDIPELGYSRKYLKDRIKDIIVKHGAEVI